ncbi:MAG: four helix bundle protein [Bacteroidales bacterium]|nr:four helix bundle protein [Bacteroidales bacterium]
MNHKELDAWKAAMDLTEKIYRESMSFPKEEQFGLISQLRRAAVSVAANIAEGAGRNSDQQLLQFLNIALGSLAELETLVLLSFTIGYLEEKNKEQLLNSIADSSKLVQGLIRNLKKKSNPARPFTTH